MGIPVRKLRVIFTTACILPVCLTGAGIACAPGRSMNRVTRLEENEMLEKRIFNAAILTAAAVFTLASPLAKAQWNYDAARRQEERQEKLLEIERQRWELEQEREEERKKREKERNYQECVSGVREGKLPASAILYCDG
ncbi:MAG: hypothetical protein LBD68_06765 [Zoogloeaceae bacterium]|nr:hypothetical protein [Zoogloeaceae bacterium]